MSLIIAPCRITLVAGLLNPIVRDTNIIDINPAMAFSEFIK